MSELTWTKADLARIDSALHAWSFQTYGHRPQGLPPHVVANARTIVCSVLLQWAAADRYPGIKPAEKRAHAKLAEWLLNEGLPPGFKPAEPPAPVVPAAPPQVPQPIDRVALARVQAAHGIRADALEGRVSVHGAGSAIGDTDELWGDYPHLVHWRVIATAAGGWKTGEISAHFPAPPGAVDLRGLPSQHGMLRADALAPLVRALRACSVGAHLVTDCHADLLARELPIWVGSV